MSNSWTLSIPSKTFLIGEYAALHAYPALLLTSAPFFVVQLKYQANKTTPFSIPFHPESPAAQYLRAHHSLLEGWELQFDDPHSGCGGFGASSAVFIASYCLVQLARRHTFALKNPADLFTHVLPAYHQVTQSKGTSPSGYDVIAQYYAMQWGDSAPQIIYLEAKKKIIQTLAWPFKKLSLELLRTGFKCVTHTHLESLSTIPCGSLNTLVSHAYEALQQGNAFAFCEAIRGYQHHLSTLHLQTQSAQQLCQAQYHDPQVLASKGCGALGCDVLLSVRKNHRVLPSLHVSLQTKDPS